MFNNYINLFLWFIFSLFLVILLFFIVYNLINKDIDYEKLSAYECGFNPFEEVVGRFDIRFYLVAILFIVFDLEVSFLFPWSIIFGFLGFVGFFSMFFFLFILIIGFLYELKRGALDW
jgi:NADH:ubiquinone oxidoreductase subunit 3 (subunit A)